MSVEVILWVTSVAGALVFFFSGWLLALGRGSLRATAAPVETMPPPVLEPTATRPDLLAALSEAQRLRRELESRSQALTSTASELAARNQALAATSTELTGKTAALAAARDDLARSEAARTAAVTAERARVEAELARARAAEAEARTALRAAHDEREEKAKQAAKLRSLQADIEKLRLDNTRIDEERAALSRQLSAHDPELEATLRHDLALEREQSRSLEARAQRLDSENEALRAENHALARATANLGALERENESLRMRALVSDLVPARAPKLGLGSSHALDGVVAQVARLPPVRAAVIGDDLGLVVACQGTHADELAAIGALFNRACAEAHKVLPLGPIRRVMVETNDDASISLTMRPIASPGDSEHEDELTLVTLAYGAEPDPGQISQIIGGIEPRQHEAVT